MIHLVREYQRRLHQILYCRFVERYQTVELDGKGETAVLIDFISADSNTQEPFHTLNLLELQRHYNVATDTYFTDSSFIDLTTVLSKRIGELLFNLIYEVEETTSGKSCQQVMVGLTQVLREFSTFVLEKDFNRILDTHPNHWHLQLLNGVSGPITNYISQKSILGDPREVEYLGHSLELLFKSNINKVEQRISRVLETLDISIDDGYEPTSNGLFIYLGKNQESAIRNFLVQDNSQLIQNGQVDEWVGFLCGKSTPKIRLTWMGRKVHFILLLKEASQRKKEDERRILPIELVGREPSWIKLYPLIQFYDDKPLTPANTTRSYASIKKDLNNQAKYIKTFFDSYKGEE